MEAGVRGPAWALAPRGAGAVRPWTTPGPRLVHIYGKEDTQQAKCSFTSDLDFSHCAFVRKDKCLPRSALSWGWGVLQEFLLNSPAASIVHTLWGCI